MNNPTALGLIDLAAAVSHDPEAADWGDVYEYIETVNNPDLVLRDVLHWMHGEELI